MVWLTGRTRPPYKEQVNGHTQLRRASPHYKLELDEGRARTVDEAQEIMAGYVLQIDVGVGVSESETRQVMLLTAVNAAVRAFLGGVRVCLREHGRMGVAWADGMDMATAVESYGGEIVESLDRDHPTLVVGDVKVQSVGSFVLHITWEGWSGGVVEETKDRLAESVEFPWRGCLQHPLEYRRHFRICEATLSPVGAQLGFRFGNRGAIGGMSPPMVNDVAICLSGSG